MTMHHNTKAPCWAAKTLATLVAGLVLAFSLPTLALGPGNASAPEAAAATAGARSRPAAPAAAPATPAITEEAVENPYGLKALWTQGDMVAHSTLIIMLIMSMGSWYVIFTKLFEQHAMLKSAVNRPTPSGRPAR
jgi:biopolymer transport protein ExbB